MKMLIAFVFGLNLAYAAPCMNFSGNYEIQSQDSETPLSLNITQTECKKIMLDFQGSDGVRIQEFELNGVKVKVFEDSEIGLVSYGTPYFKGNDILINMENHWSDNGTVEKFKRRLHLEFGEKTILLDQVGDFRSDGVFVPKTQTAYDKK